LACLGSPLAGRALANEAKEARAASGLSKGKPTTSSFDVYFFQVESMEQYTLSNSNKLK
jgi:hypothetical protein